MTNGNRSPVARYVRRLVHLPRAGELSDAQLLERFVAQRDEVAFEVLVGRHGPKVLGVCRRVLRHEQDAEDAFQATFLVLVRKAASIGRSQAVGHWLYRVAYRVALRAKVLADKRAARQTPFPDVPAAVGPPDPVWSDLRPVLDEEVNRLPAKYRAPFVLCYLDGKTNAEAARELGCPRGTVLSRLAWARERLRAQLIRRGLTLSAGLLAAALATNKAAAAVPAALAASTLQAALLVAMGKAVADVVSGPVALLTKGALQTMRWTNGMIVMACVLAVGALGLGRGLARQTAEDRPVLGQAVSGPDAPADNRDQPPAKAEPRRYALEMRDKPWASVFEWYSDLTSLPYIGTVKPTGTFTFVPAPGKRQYTLEEITDFLNEALLAQKYLLVRRDASFTVLPAEEKIDPSLLPRVGVDDLEKRGKTELVTVMLALANLTAKELAPDVKKLLGPFGEVVVLEKANQFILQDTAGNLRRICQTIKDVEAREAEKKRDPKRI
jgi:RNA polymerase sigma factor (sigma-70 family)